MSRRVRRGRGRINCTSSSEDHESPDVTDERLSRPPGGSAPPGVSRRTIQAGAKVRRMHG